MTRRRRREQRDGAADAARERATSSSRMLSDETPSSRTSSTSTSTSCSTRAGVERGDVDLRSRRPALHALLKERLLARVQAGRRGPEGVAARQLRRGAASRSAEGVPDGERLWARATATRTARSSTGSSRASARPGTRSTSQVLLAADYGVPQLRQRLFCVGIREDLLDVPADFWRLPVAAADALRAARDAERLGPRPCPRT